MAKSKNKKRNAPQRSSRDNDMDTDFGSGADIREGREQSNEETGIEVSNRNSGGQKRRASSQTEEGFDFDPKQLWESFRGYIEEHPGRASALGAVVGGVAAGLLASETGRSLLRASYGYARPMIADYARKFVSSQTEGAIERSLPQ